MSDTDSRPPDRPDDQAPGPEPEGEPSPPTPEKPPIDFRSTPDGVRPSAWENLPPPEIVRPEPEAQRTRGELTREFLQSRVGKQIMIGLGAVLLALLLICSFRPPASVRSHHGALELFCRGLEARDPEAMRAVCTGIAAERCEDVLALITVMEQSGDASHFADAWGRAGGSQGAITVPAHVICEGENGDDFLRINMLVTRQGDDTWRISELDTEPL
ncbi:hypothetical protein JXA47_14890 [Candidatus Sumerlaeota bacterium]|nr:hypothetical protein [Candidatus Sumerlaeota bacterium]